MRAAGGHFAGAGNGARGGGSHEDRRDTLEGRRGGGVLQRSGRQGLRRGRPAHGPEVTAAPPFARPESQQVERGESGGEREGPARERGRVRRAAGGGT